MSVHKGHARPANADPIPLKAQTICTRAEQCQLGQTKPKRTPHKYKSNRDFESVPENQGFVCSRIDETGH